MTREEAIKYLSEEQEKTKEVVALTERDFKVSESVWHTEYEAFALAIAALREQGGSFQNGNDHNTVKDWPPYMDLPRDRDVTDINVGNKWISVAERLPKPHETVLVIRRNQRKKLSVECGYYMGSGDWQVGTRLTRPVTHWMPLPELPKEE